MAKLVITGADGARREIELTTKDLRIGRAPENDLPLPDESKGVSRMHAELRYENGRYVVIDLNSQNGTWLDGARVQRADVASGSEIAIGPYRLSFIGTGGTVDQAKSTEEIAGIGPGTMRVDAPARPAAPPPARAAAPPKRPAGRPVPAAQSPGPIAALASLPKPILLGGFFAIALIIIVLGQLFAPSEPASPTPGTTADGTAPAVPGTETNAQIVERNLTDAKALIEKQDFEGAIRDHLDRILLIDPNHAEATDLKMKAQEALRAEAAAPPDAPASAVPAAAAANAATPPASSGAGAAATAPGARASTTVQPSAPAAAAAPRARSSRPPATSPAAPAAAAAAPLERLPSDRRPNETVPQWRARNADLTAQYNAAKGALDKRSFATAIAGFEALVKAEPAYLDAPQLLVRAREESRALGKEAFDAGSKAEAAGNWTAAIENYERAQKIDPALGAEDAANRVRDRMAVAGADAFKRGRQFDAVGRTADALKEYANAAQWLPDNDANKAVARQRVDQLKAGQK